MRRETSVNGPADTPGGSGSGTQFDDWAVLLTSRIEAFVSLIRDRTVNPVLQIVKYIVFGVIAVFVGVFLAVLFSITLIRVLNDEVFHSRVWASYFVVAGIFLITGLFLSRMRRPRA